MPETDPFPVKSGGIKTAAAIVGRIHFVFDEWFSDLATSQVAAKVQFLAGHRRLDEGHTTCTRSPPLLHTRNEMRIREIDLLHSKGVRFEFMVYLGNAQLSGSHF
jgi:hypothetical protein